jgi:hypothetical protein
LSDFNRDSLLYSPAQGVVLEIIIGLTVRLGNLYQPVPGVIGICGGLVPLCFGDEVAIGVVSITVVIVAQEPVGGIIRIGAGNVGAQPVANSAT